MNATNVTSDEFAASLAAYPSLIARISSDKAKPGQKSLAQLDAYRYDDAPRSFNRSGASMTMQDVQTLVEWKLRHGKFRPTLMNLIKSNPESSSSVIHDAVGKYRASGDADAAVTELCKLRGVGPATASLLLSVHDSNVPFFSDEAFWWLCRGGKKDSIKYTPGEYRELRGAAKSLGKRLGVTAQDIEKAAYVIMKEGPEQTRGGTGGNGTKPKADTKAKSDEPSNSKAKEASATKAATASKPKPKPKPKRKTEDHPDGLRRSKRHA